MHIRLGTSGWQYKHWRERFYPRGLPGRAWLPFYTERFATVELNNSFYRLPEKASFELCPSKFGSAKRGSSSVRVASSPS